MALKFTQNPDGSWTGVSDKIMPAPQRQKLDGTPKGEPDSEPGENGKGEAGDGETENGKKAK